MSVAVVVTSLDNDDVGDGNIQFGSSSAADAPMW